MVEISRFYDGYISTTGFPIPVLVYIGILYIGSVGLNIKMSFYRYGNSHVKDETVGRPSYFWHGDPIPGKTVFILRRTQGDRLILNMRIAYLERPSLYWDRAQGDRLILNMGIPYLERPSLYWDGAQGPVLHLPIYLYHHANFKCC